MLIINLAGIPPIPGFLAKWVVFYESLRINIKLFISSLLVLRRLNLYIYIRIIRNELIKRARKEQKNRTNLRYFINNIILMTMILPLILTSL
jgi:NADH:ubiquinone oxidoreductase subunit 2 (subunit N)